MSSVSFKPEQRNPGLGFVSLSDCMTMSRGFVLLRFCADRAHVCGLRELVLVLFVRLFDLRVFGFYLFLLPLGVWDGLRFVIVALPGLFSYPVLWFSAAV